MSGDLVDVELVEARVGLACCRDSNTFRDRYGSLVKHAYVFTEPNALIKNASWTRPVSPRPLLHGTQKEGSSHTKEESRQESRQAGTWRTQ